MPCATSGNRMSCGLPPMGTPERIRRPLLGPPPLPCPEKAAVRTHCRPAHGHRRARASAGPRSTRREAARRSVDAPQVAFGTGTAGAARLEWRCEFPPEPVRGVLVGLGGAADGGRRDQQPAQARVLPPAQSEAAAHPLRRRIGLDRFHLQGLGFPQRAQPLDHRPEELAVQADRQAMRPERGHPVAVIEAECPFCMLFPTPIGRIRSRHNAHVRALAGRGQDARGGIN